MNVWLGGTVLWAVTRCAEQVALGRAGRSEQADAGSQVLSQMGLFSVGCVPATDLRPQAACPGE